MERHRDHGEWFYAPVNKKGQEDRLGGLARLDHFGKIDLDHDRIHHEEEGDGDGDLIDRDAVEGDRCLRE